MTPPLDLGHMLLILTSSVLLEAIWLRMIVRRILLTPQVAIAAR